MSARQANFARRAQVERNCRRLPVIRPAHPSGKIVVIARGKQPVGQGGSPFQAPPHLLDDPPNGVIDPEFAEQDPAEAGLWTLEPRAARRITMSLRCDRIG